MPAARTRSRTTQVQVVVEKELGNGRVAPASILAFRTSMSCSKSARLWMFFRIGGNADFESRRCLRMPATKSVELCVTVRMRLVFCVQMPPGGSPRRATIWRTPSCQYWRTTSSTSAFDAPTQVRWAAGFRSVSLDQAGDGGVGALTRCAAGAICDRNEVRIDRRQSLDGRARARLPTSSDFGGKNSNETLRVRSIAMPRQAAVRAPRIFAQSPNSRLSCFVRIVDHIADWKRGSRPVQIDTVSLPCCSPCDGFQVSMLQSRGSRPAHSRKALR